ncbi:S-adenosyl-L-methionine-dependent methyltransferase [Glarea lozoyensis ATCC 20868]|uniref:S-adenosyl-L-methionine-dependent methyltransferase n=1 Tax=Glarea lozoyensis (strain ATCC 20868 / MF5171) TaxID=1116229 RepID=S3DA85_GLAL2|nr:S-adenosyl-L-methionine-dependent methyltransferase [Glarea lozoyensis ATCC 20868]EPE28876.1 S-adenosyl-L-methionine-dependent methyltransferase [Glarea lozoyensis ATCC 20868]
MAPSKKPSKSPGKTTKIPIPQSTDPLLTQENFEKELKALASKAKEETTAKWAREQAWVLIQSGTLLSLAAIYSNVSLLSLSPVYGSIPSSTYHSKGVMSACFLGWSLNLFLKRRIPVKPILLLPVLAAYIPVIQFFLCKFSGTFGGRYGPILIETLSFLPLLFLSVSCTATVLEDLDMNPGRWQWLSDATPGIASYAFYKAVEFYSGNYISGAIGSSIVHTRIGLSLLLTGLYAIFSPSKLLLYTLPAVLHTAIFNTHLPTPYSTASLNAELQQMGWSLVDRQESLTGYISIIESAENRFRVMRCDHSLLGGEWFSRDEGPNEPIYGVFVMLEAVRLVKVEIPAPYRQKSALVIGLGIGTTPAAFIAHGINTTIVEIDPVVHSFATKYFALPTTHTPVIEDAVAFANRTARAGTKYDYIVHDVFTGGAEPIDLFTLEFIQDLYDMLEDWGVIALNYAGDLTLPPSRIITTTIRTIFPSCRIFRESPAPSAAKIADEGRDFTNMVIFCTRTPVEEIAFAYPTAPDFLNSRARKAFLVPQHEVLDSAFKKAEEGEMRVLTRASRAGFEGWQRESALGHWGVMRGVLPPRVWEMW